MVSLARSPATTTTLRPYVLYEFFVKSIFQLWTRFAGVRTDGELRGCGELEVYSCTNVIARGQNQASQEKRENRLILRIRNLSLVLIQGCQLSQMVARSSQIRTPLATRNLYI